jgi:hypothetical protein
MTASPELPWRENADTSLSLARFSDGGNRSQRGIRNDFAYAAPSAMSRDETGLNPRQRHRSNENSVAEMIPGDGVLG